MQFRLDCDLVFDKWDLHTVLSNIFRPLCLSHLLQWFKTWGVFVCMFASRRLREVRTGAAQKWPPPSTTETNHSTNKSHPCCTVIVISLKSVKFLPQSPQLPLLWSECCFVCVAYHYSYRHEHSYSWNQTKKIRWICFIQDCFRSSWKFYFVADEEFRFPEKNWVFFTIPKTGFDLQLRNLDFQKKQGFFLLLRKRGFDHNPTNSQCLHIVKKYFCWPK